MTGGYKILDLKGTDFTVGQPTEVPGIYEAVEGSRKAFMLSNYSVGGVEQKDRFVSLDLVGTSYQSLGNVFTDSYISIAENDMVTIVENSEEV